MPAAQFRAGNAGCPAGTAFTRIVFYAISATVLISGVQVRVEAAMHLL